ncbi:uncharacterized protein LOC119108473 [Pollicipes pollicipes]|uniref:uncharacterized protein LOC119108473 n=1 Tax=Pollicipes pollicipes TaxID=41117 RepID=UPI001884F3A9|nr:uncharacterized protein LOC119108473 [Pollicipes pollicipes]
MRAAAALLALLCLLVLVTWGTAWPRGGLEAALTSQREQKRSSFVRLGRAGAGQELDPEPQPELEPQPQPQRPREQQPPPVLPWFDRVTRPSFLRLGRRWFDRMNRASSIRLGRRGSDTYLPTSYKRYRIRLKRSV